jgi:hypothetical protein
MKRICAWCGADLDDLQAHDRQTLTHGLCVDCRSRFFPARRGKDALANDEGSATAESGKPAVPSDHEQND